MVACHRKQNHETSTDYFIGTNIRKSTLDK